MDNVIRNSVIAQLQPLGVHTDKGQLRENFLISERMKYLSYTHSLANNYFWSTAQQQEVDYVEESGGEIYGYEFKWSERRNVKIPKTFTNTYKSINKIINRQNFRVFNR